MTRDALTSANENNTHVWRRRNGKKQNPKKPTERRKTQAKTKAQWRKRDGELNHSLSIYLIWSTNQSSQRLRWRFTKIYPSSNSRRSEPKKQRQTVKRDRPTSAPLGNRREPPQINQWSNQTINQMLGQSLNPLPSVRVCVVTHVCVFCSFFRVVGVVCCPLVLGKDHVHGATKTRSRLTIYCKRFVTRRNKIPPRQQVCRK